MFKFTKNFDKAYTQSFDQSLRNYYLMIYTYVTLGLLITALMAFAVLNFAPLTHLMYNMKNGLIAGPSGFGMIMNVVPILISVYFFMGFGAMSLDKARFLFWIYCATIGANLSYMGLIYTGHSLVKGLLITTSAFAAISLYGYTTKTDLSKYSSFFMMGIIGVLVASVINIFFRSTALDMLVSLVGVVAFMGFIAWDNQKIKQIYYQCPNGEIAQKYAIISAFNLYLNFINLFLYMMRFFGDRKND